MFAPKLPPEEASDFERDASSITDLVLLDEVSCESITREVASRFERGETYTAIGPVLIALNPYTWLKKRGKCIYREAVARFYFEQEALEVAPHIFTVATRALKSLRSERVDQCVLVSGESGAGKTETAKQLMAFIAVTSGGGATLENVKQQLMHSNPVLEGFGNAQTMRNDNSSRFGKYMELSFDFKGDVQGGKVSNYLLEKSRITGHSEGERGFHIFHQLTVGADDEMRKALSDLGPPSDYAYLRRADERIEGVDDAVEFVEWRRASISVLSKISYDRGDEMELFSLVAFVLALGQLEFVDRGADVSATCADQNKLKTAAGLAGLKPCELHLALTARKLSLRRNCKRSHSVTMACLDAEASQRSAATLAKETYKRLFDWLVQQINLAVTPRNPAFSMGILDIFGFEIFEHNGFEQFCINYVNEKLQQYFLELTLKAEQEEYAAEGMPWEEVGFFDNKVVCELIEAKKPPHTVGILALLDETAAFRDSGTFELMAKFTSNLQGSQHFAASAKKATSFTIVHYAGSVDYSALDFLEKNADSMFNDLIELMGEQSEASLPRALFRDARTDEAKAKMPQSVSVQFKGQVNELIATLRHCKPNYVRCIKPNDEKKPLEIDLERVAHQVQYLGLVQNVRVRRAGYAYRCDFRRFVLRFKTTMPPKRSSCLLKEQVVALIVNGAGVVPDVPILKEGRDFVVGKTKVFIKEPRFLFALERRRRVCIERIVSTKLQAPVRRKKASRHYQKCRAATTLMAAQVRRSLAMRMLRVAVCGVISLQAALRQRTDFRIVAGMKFRFRGTPPRQWAGRIQRMRRGHVVRKRLPRELYEKCASLALEMDISRRAAQNNRAASTISRLCRLFISAKSLARKERQEFERYMLKLTNGDEGLSVIRHLKGSILKEPHPEDARLLFDREKFALISPPSASSKSAWGVVAGTSRTSFFPLENVISVRRCHPSRLPPPGRVLPRYLDDNTNTKKKRVKDSSFRGKPQPVTTMFDPATLSKFIVMPAKVIINGKLNRFTELTLEFASEHERDALYRVVHVLKYDRSHRQWSVFHARQTESFLPKHWLQRTPSNTELRSASSTLASSRSYTTRPHTRRHTQAPPVDFYDEARPSPSHNARRPNQIDPWNDPRRLLENLLDDSNAASAWV